MPCSSMAGVPCPKTCTCQCTGPMRREAAVSRSGQSRPSCSQRRRRERHVLGARLRHPEPGSVAKRARHRRRAWVDSSPPSRSPGAGPAAAVAARCPRNSVGNLAKRRARALLMASWLASRRPLRPCFPMLARPSVMTTNTGLCPRCRLASDSPSAASSPRQSGVVPPQPAPPSSDGHAAAIGWAARAASPRGPERDQRDVIAADVAVGEHALSRSPWLPPAAAAAEPRHRPRRSRRSRCAAAGGPCGSLPGARARAGRTSISASLAGGGAARCGGLQRWQDLQPLTPRGDRGGHR